MWKKILRSKRISLNLLFHLAQMCPANDLRLKKYPAGRAPASH
jgi:hypothetical protein